MDIEERQPDSNECAEGIRLTAAYKESGKATDFYALQHWLSRLDPTTQSLAPEIDKMLKTVLEAQNKTGSTDIPTSKIQGADTCSPDATAVMAEMFANEIESIRSESEFHGTEMQMDCLRDILDCDSRYSLCPQSRIS